MAYSKNHSPINWRNYPSTSTPINETNLNKMDSEIGVNDDRIVALSVDKADATEVNTALNGKVDKVTGKGLSTNDYTTAEKTKLSGISANAKNVSITQVVTTGDTLANITIDGTTTAIKAKKITVDDMLSSTSENPVQNKIIYEALNNILPEETAEGNPISITDASGLSAKSCEVTMNPIQDLHGQSAPYPAGGGKNKIDGDTFFSGYKIATNSYEATNTQIVNTKLYLGDYVGQTITFSLNFTSVSGVNRAFVQGYIDGTNINGTSITSSGVSKVTVTPTSNSDFIHITYGSLTGTLNFKWNNVQLEIGETATTFAPYSNICPISGRDSVDVVVTGANQWDEEWELGQYNITTGEKIGSASNIRSKNKIPVFQGKTYRFVIPTGITMRYLLYNKDESYSGLTGTKTNGGTLEIPSDIGFMAFHLSEGTTYNNDISINYPPTDTEYHAYNGQTKTITFPSTIYGGTDEVVGGTGVSNMLLLDLGSKTWTRSTSYTNPFFYTNLASKEKSTLTNNGICENYTKFAITRVDGAVFGNNAPNNTFATNTTNGNQIFIRDDNYTSASDFKTAMSGVYLCYELATPTPFSTEPTPIELLKGTNVVSTDGDKFYLTYTADIKSYIDGKLAELQS